MATVTRNLINKLRKDDLGNLFTVYGKVEKFGCSVCTLKIFNDTESYELHNIDFLARISEGVLPDTATEAIVDFTVEVPKHLGLLLKENDEIVVDLSVYKVKEMYFTVLAVTIYRNNGFVTTVPLQTGIYYFDLATIVRYA